MQPSDVLKIMFEWLPVIVIAVMLGGFIIGLIRQTFSHD